jgi:HEAT repeat protein
MKKNRVIEFDPKERILRKAKKMIESPELFREGGQAIPFLLKAIKHAGRDLKREIVYILAMFADKEEIVWPLYDLMTDPLEEEEVRHDAAIQLSVIGRSLKNPQPLIERLLKEIESSDAEQRLHATFALGWEGNFHAATSLVGRLYDTDPRVQATAVNALSNLRDDRILDLLVDRLEHGSREQKKSILFNLWRFRSKGEKVTNVYFKCLEDQDPELRFEALVCLRPITEIRECLEVYRKCLKDEDERIRELALKRLAEDAAERVLKSLRAEIEALLDDPCVKVKRAALNILRGKKNRRVSRGNVESSDL